MEGLSSQQQQKRKMEENERRGDKRKMKGHAQQLGWSQRNSESNAKTLGDRTASDGEFVFSKRKMKGHAQQLGWSQRNSESNAKTLGDRTASDGEFVFSTTVKASKDEASHDCRGRIRAEFERNSIDWYVPLPNRILSFRLRDA
jgi:hypothetical protein